MLARRASAIATTASADECAAAAAAAGCKFGIFGIDDPAYLYSGCGIFKRKGGTTRRGGPQVACQPAVPAGDGGVADVRSAGRKGHGLSGGFVV
jgi:hypothetical protein